MFKTITTVILLLALSVQILNRVVVYIDYYANSQAYAQNCENKSIPLMHCNGKCQMIKKLKEQEKRDDQLPERKSINDFIATTRSYFISSNAFRLNNKPAYNLFCVREIKDMPHSFFHPPGA